MLAPQTNSSAETAGHQKTEILVKIQIPVRFGILSYRSLVMRRLPDIAAFIDDRGSNLDTAIAAIALSALVPQQVVERLGPRDYMRACETMEQLHPEVVVNGE